MRKGIENILLATQEIMNKERKGLGRALLGNEMEPKYYNTSITLLSFATILGNPVILRPAFLQSRNGVRSNVLVIEMLFCRSCT
jgi:hypothetical protein